MISIAKVEATAEKSRLYEFFARHRFTGLYNAQRVYAQARPDLWFAHDGGVLAGALLSVEQERVEPERESGLRGCVENCLVAEPYRQRGIARDLLRAAEAHYQARGVSRGPRLLQRQAGLGRKASAEPGTPHHPQGLRRSVDWRWRHPSRGASPWNHLDGSAE